MFGSLWHFTTREVKALLSIIVSLLRSHIKQFSFLLSIYLIPVLLPPEKPKLPPVLMTVNKASFEIYEYFFSEFFAFIILIEILFFFEFAHFFILLILFFVYALLYIFI